jgi:hypothetical protein
MENTLTPADGLKPEESQRPHFNLAEVLRATAADPLLKTISGQQNREDETYEDGVGVQIERHFGQLSTDAAAVTTDQIHALVGRHLNDNEPVTVVNQDLAAAVLRDIVPEQGIQLLRSVLTDVSTVDLYSAPQDRPTRDPFSIAHVGTHGAGIVDIELTYGDPEKGDYYVVDIVDGDSILPEYITGPVGATLKEPVSGMAVRVQAANPAMPHPITTELLIQRDPTDPTKYSDTVTMATSEVTALEASFYKKPIQTSTSPQQP